MRSRKEPGPDHPISIEAIARPVRVSTSGRTLAESKTYLSLSEATYPKVAYIPRDAADFTQLERSDHTTWCPFKGEANYYHVLKADGRQIENAVWTYEDPFPAVAEIRACLAFYPNKVDIALAP